MCNYTKKLVTLCMTVLLTTLPVLPALALDPVMPHDQVKPGMFGTAYTVVDSTGEIKNFNVDIVGNMDNGKGSQPMIMAKASGPVIQEAGGILQGMSGSPVYVNGYLVGAVAAGIKEMTPYTFFITPIDEMLPLWKMPDRKNITRLRTIDLKKAAADKAKQKAEQEKKEAEPAKADNAGKISGEELVARARKAAAEAANAETNAGDAAAKSDSQAMDTAVTESDAEAKPEVTAEPKNVMYVGGFNQAGLNFLRQQLDPKGQYSFMPMGNAGSASNLKTDYNATLKPGAAVGVAVAYGDFAVGATGTVTAVDGKNVLAFGHPFLHRGNVNYFMTDATVVGTISGQSNGMKIANIGNIIGRVNQDRATGIAGKLGVFPSVVPIKVAVKDNSLAKEKSFGASIAYDEDFLAQLSGGIAYAALSKTADDLSGSTAKVDFKIRTNAVKDGIVSRSNMFYNKADVGQIAMTELMQAMDIICQNGEQESDIIDVNVNVTVDSDRKTAVIISAVPDKKKVKPGDTVKFTTTIKPYRKSKETVVIPFKVPLTQPAGVMNVDVRGGGLVPVTALMVLQQSGIDINSENETKQTTTADKLKKLQENGRNNEIIITPGVQQPLSPQQQQKILQEALSKKQAAGHKANLLDSAKKDLKAGETKYETNYIIENVIHTSLQIERK